MTPVIEVDQLTRRFDGPEPIWALRDCTFSVVSGETVAITGPSGTGKSTLLNCLGLLDRPTSGRYSLRGRDVAALPERKRAAVRSQEIGFVFQDYHLLAGRTARDNVALGLLYRRVPASDRHRRADALLEEVGLAHRRAALVQTLSGGERQRVAIARALASRPSLLLCDEPTGNLDTDTSEAIIALLMELRAPHQTTVIVTHDLAIAAKADRRFRMRDGRIAEEGS